MKGFEQALAVKQVWQNIKPFSYKPLPAREEFSIFLGAGFLDDSDKSDSQEPLDDGSWSVSAFLLPKKFLRSPCFDILAAVCFLVIYRLDRKETQ